MTQTVQKKYYSFPKYLGAAQKISILLFSQKLFLNPRIRFHCKSPDKINGQCRDYWEMNKSAEIAMESKISSIIFSKDIKMFKSSLIKILVQLLYLILIGSAMSGPSSLRVTTTMTAMTTRTSQTTRSSASQLSSSSPKIRFLSFWKNCWISLYCSV